MWNLIQFTELISNEKNTYHNLESKSVSSWPISYKWTSPPTSHPNDNFSCTRSALHKCHSKTLSNSETLSGTFMVKTVFLTPRTSFVFFHSQLEQKYTEVFQRLHDMWHLNRLNVNVDMRIQMSLWNMTLKRFQKLKATFLFY